MVLVRTDDGHDGEVQGVGEVRVERIVDVRREPLDFVLYSHTTNRAISLWGEDQAWKGSVWLR
jgi:hypothetical protein